MADAQNLEACFLPIEQRTPPQSCFFRVIGRDAQGKIPALLERFQAQAKAGGVVLQNGLRNPAEPEITQLYTITGRSFALSRPVMERHMTVWLGQLRPAARPTLSGAMEDTLNLLRAQGANDNILKNAYIKFMCWLHGPLGRILSGLGKASPPKVLYQGDIWKYEALLLRLLHQAGCDVWYANWQTEESYRKADPGGRFSQLVQGELLSPPAPPKAPEPPKPAPVRASPPPAPARPAQARPKANLSRPLGPAPWAGMDEEVQLNRWAGDKPVWEAVLQSSLQRAAGEGPKLRALFAILMGADDRAVYRNRLFRLKRELDASSKVWLLADQRIPAPTNAETEPFRSLDKSLPRPHLIRALAQTLKPSCGRVHQLLAQRALAQVLEQDPEQDGVRLYNHGVRLACWLGRYAGKLFDRYQEEHPPAFLYYGVPTEWEAALLWALAQMGADVLCISPDQKGRAVFDNHFLPHLWTEVRFEGSLPLEPFPQREEKVRAGTTAYNASRELDQLLYSDTGMFRDRQFTRSQPVTLKTTYDEVGQLWPEEAQYRPSFRAEAGVVYVPNLFSKISGVDQGDIELYWDRIQAMLTPETLLFQSVPFLQVNGPSMSNPQARSFLHSGKLDPKALKASSFYRYDYLPDDTQDYILEKIQALIDYDLIVDGGSDLAASMLSVLMNLDKELLRLLQSFDFTRVVPKILIVDVTEKVFTLEECILLAFLNLVGFDIAVFTPTGYRNLEKHLRPDSFDTLTAGPFLYDLTVPNLRTRRPRSKGGGWLGRLFGG